VGAGLGKRRKRGRIRIQGPPRAVNSLTMLKKKEQCLNTLSDGGKFAAGIEEPGELGKTTKNGREAALGFEKRKGKSAENCKLISWQKKNKKKPIAS